MKKIICLLSIFLFACSTSSVEYRTATTALRNDLDYNKAEEFAKKALEVLPEDALPAYFLAMEVYASPTSPKKDYKQAAYYFDKAIEIDAIDGKDQKLESPVFVQLPDGSPKELKTIKEAIDYYSYSIWADSFNEGITLISQGKNTEAVDLFLVAAQFQPNDPKNYNALSTLYYELGDYEKAAINADKALDMDTSFSTLWSIKGSLAMDSNDLILAEDMFRKAYNVAIKNQESAENLSGHMSRLFDILYKNNKKDEALLLNEQLIESNPESVELYRNAGAVYQNIVNDNLELAMGAFLNLNELSEIELEDLKIQFTDCIDFCTKARQNFLMCSELEIDDIDSEEYYNESKKLKSKINDIKQMIKKIDKRLDE